MRRAVLLKEIPEDIKKKYKMIGRGATSIVFKKDKSTALVFTRDPMKVDWLLQPWGLSIGRIVSHIQPLDDGIIESQLGPIHVIEVPLLRKLSPKNRKIVNKVVRQFKEFVNNCAAKGVRRDECMKKLMDKLEHKKHKYPESLFYHLADFLTYYDHSQFRFDVAIRDIMEDSKGDIVLLDPIVATDVMKYIHNMKI